MAWYILYHLEQIYPSDNAIIVMNRLLSVALFITVGATLVLTVLIAYHIHSVCKQNNHIRSPLSHTLVLIVQSVVAYLFIAYLPLIKKFTAHFYSYFCFSVVLHSWTLWEVLGKCGGF